MTDRVAGDDDDPTDRPTGAGLRRVRTVVVIRLQSIILHLVSCFFYDQLALIVCGIWVPLKRVLHLIHLPRAAQ